jgi:hypothetical protein
VSGRESRVLRFRATAARPDGRRISIALRGVALKSILAVEFFLMASFRNWIAKLRCYNCHFRFAVKRVPARDILAVPDSAKCPRCGAKAAPHGFIAPRKHLLLEIEPESSED